MLLCSFNFFWVHLLETPGSNMFLFAARIIQSVKLQQRWRQSQCTLLDDFVCLFIVWASCPRTHTGCPGGLENHPITQIWSWNIMWGSEILGVSRPQWELPRGLEIHKWGLGKNSSRFSRFGKTKILIWCVFYIIFTIFLVFLLCVESLTQMLSIFSPSNKEKTIEVV